MDPALIRNFCIIAHIDHGKSTLADRFLEITDTVRPKDMKAQFLDQMDLERERGITIKGKAVTMSHLGPDGKTYQINLIDTPGHVDFSYEVSRALAACEGAVLVVDSSQGIEAQTIANTLMALDSNLVLIPVINKIDLPQAEPQRVAVEMGNIFGFKPEEILFVSAKDGTGAQEILNAVIQRIPPPPGISEAPLRSLVFDSLYNPYKGIIAHIRVQDGKMSKHDRIQVMSTGKATEAVEVGLFSPFPQAVDSLIAGQVGYIATGFKDVRECTVGDTLTAERQPAKDPLPGYSPLKSMVFASIYPSDGEEYNNLRTALEKLHLNDASLSFEPEVSTALGFGFRCGFLGLMHLEIVQERLEREHDVALIATAPSVAYHVVLTTGETIIVDSPSKLPSNQSIKEIREPILALTIVAPSRHVGVIMELMHVNRSEFKRMDYIQGATGLPANQVADTTQDRVVMEYTMPMVEMLADFYNQLKSRTQGYASLDYTVNGYRQAPLVKVDILVNQLPVDALSMILHRDMAIRQGRTVVEKLKETIPRQLFEVPIQAAIGGRIIARETVRPLRKDVLAKCYGGDVTRKRKLLEKQKEGKRRLKMVGKVEIPQEAFMTMLKLGSED